MVLPQQHRLRSPRDFSRVYRKGQKATTPHLVVRALKAKRSSSVSKESARRRPKQPMTQSSASARPLTTGVSTGASTGTDNPVLTSRFGIAISRKVSKQAVVRNHIKRQLRAILRRYLPQVLPGWQVVIVVRPSAVECDFDDFLRELEYLLKKLEIVTKPEVRHGY